MGLIRGTFILANPTRPDLAALERREVVLADGHRRTVPYVGPVEDMDLVLRPQLQSVDVNPDSPNIPLSVAKHER